MGSIERHGRVFTLRSVQSIVDVDGATARLIASIDGEREPLTFQIDYQNALSLEREVARLYGTMTTRLHNQPAVERAEIERGLANAPRPDDVVLRRNKRTGDTEVLIKFRNHSAFMMRIDDAQMHDITGQYQRLHVGALN